MSDTFTAINHCLKVDGLIHLLPYDEKRVELLSSILLWSFIRLNKEQKTLFGDDSWLSEGNKLPVTFNGVGAEFQYQLKALTLGMYNDAITNLLLRFYQRTAPDAKHRAVRRSN